MIYGTPARNSAAHSPDVKPFLHCKKRFDMVF